MGKVFCPKTVITGILPLSLGARPTNRKKITQAAQHIMSPRVCQR